MATSHALHAGAQRSPKGLLWRLGCMLLAHAALQSLLMLPYRAAVYCWTVIAFVQVLERCMDILCTCLSATVAKDIV